MSNSFRNSYNNKWNNKFFWLTIFNVFPVLVLIQNISIFFFINLVIYSDRNSINTATSKTSFWATILWIFGSVNSVILIPSELHNSNELFINSLKALPNYIYWSILIIFFLTNKNRIDLNTFYKGTFLGLLLFIFYYYTLNSISKNIFFLQNVTPNSFAFIMICYTPPAIYYLKAKYGKKYAILALLIVLYLMLTGGRRAGFGIIFLTGIGTLISGQLKLKTIFRSLLILLFSIILINTEFIENIILSGSERIHELIYETDKVQTQDRSHLTRKAQVEKGLNLFFSHPFSGIGIINFSLVEGDIEGNFEGSEFVVNKDEMNALSAHNSYITILAEGGLIMFIPFIILLGLPIFNFLFKITRIPIEHHPIYLGLIGMSIHFYFITAVVNVYAWFLLGIATAIMYRK